MKKENKRKETWRIGIDKKWEKVNFKLGLLCLKLETYNFLLFLGNNMDCYVIGR